MSTIEPNDEQANGYGLPEDTRRQLKKLHEYVTFLVRLTQPRQANEEPAEIHSSEWALCLDQLEQRVAPVMEALSQGVEREKEMAASTPDAETEAHEGEDADAWGADAEAASTSTSPSSKRYLSGITLDQIDEINLLLSNLHAVGNVVCCADHAEYSVATLAVMGDAIYRDVDKIHDIVDTIYKSQRFEPKYTLNTVREASASYLTLPERSPAGSALLQACELPVYH